MLNFINLAPLIGCYNTHFKNLPFHFSLNMPLVFAMVTLECPAERTKDRHVFLTHSGHVPDNCTLSAPRDNLGVQCML